MELGSRCFGLIEEYFGGPNRTLYQLVWDDWKSNNNWRDLSRLYRLNDYVGYQASRQGVKYHADLWEAWWGALFKDRELWNPEANVDDLLCVLQNLIYRKYQGLISSLSAASIPGTNRTECHKPILQSAVTSPIPISVVRKEDPQILSTLTSIKTLPDDTPVFGYRGTVSGAAGCADIQIFDPDESTCRAIAKIFTNSDFTCLSPEIIG
jgi:hypothetical protein